MAGTTFKVVIPARYGSSRLPGKPLLEIAGAPLIRHVYERAAASTAAEIVVATDNVRIADVCTAFGADVALTKADHPSGTDRVAEVAEIRGWPRDSILVILQGDEPCLPPILIDQVAHDLSGQGSASVATLAYPIHDQEILYDPHTVKVVTDADGYALYFSRAPIPWPRDGLIGACESSASGVRFLRHIGLYAYRLSSLVRFVGRPPAPPELAESLEQLRVLWYGEAIHVAWATEEPGPGVDTPADVLRVARFLGRR